MADQNDRAGIVGNQFLQQIKRIEIQIIGRLVKHQQIGRLCQSAGKHRSGALAAGKLAHSSTCLLRREQEILHVTENMALLISDHQHVANTAGQHVFQALRVIKLLALLVERQHFQIGTQLDAAAVRLDLPGEEFYKGGFAGSVRPDNTNPVAAVDAHRKAGNDAASIIGFGNLRRLNDALAGAFRLCCLHVDRTGALAQIAACVAQRMKPVETPDIAFAPCGHAVAQPVFFANNLAVQLVALGFLFLQHLVAPALKSGKPFIDAPGHAAVNPDSRTCQTLQKGTVMADQHKGGPH